MCLRVGGGGLPLIPEINKGLLSSVGKFKKVMGDRFQSNCHSNVKASQGINLCCSL